MKKSLFRHTFRYASFVWLTAVVVAPVLYSILNAIFHIKSWVFEGVGFLFFAILYGGVFSIPCWLLLILFSYIICRFVLDGQARKVLLFITGTVLTFAIFFSFFGKESMLSGDVALPLSYWLSISFGIFYYNLNGPSRPENLLEGPLDQL